jgi:hypothetical protein
MKQSSVGFINVLDIQNCAKMKIGEFWKRTVLHVEHYAWRIMKQRNYCVRLVLVLVGENKFILVLFSTMSHLQPLVKLIL